MALITEIIKRYEAQAKERVKEARQEKAAKNTDTAIINRPALASGASQYDIGTAPSGIDSSTKDPTEQDFAYFDWQNRLVDFYKHVKNANLVLQELNSASNILAELQRLREENMRLKEKLAQHEG